MASPSTSSGWYTLAKPTRTRPVSAAQVRAYAAKAQEFTDAAASDFEAGRNIAATSLAIHAGINAADAVCGARLGKRAADVETVRWVLIFPSRRGRAPHSAGQEPHDDPRRDQPRTR